jgi:8-oxo-dGTP diphosphatase
VQKNIHVVGAVVLSSGKVLCVQRGPHGTLPGLWEFPGGKIEPGETAQEALRREIAEELECHVTVGEKVTTTRHEYAFGIVHLTTFYCELIDGSPELSEHSDMAWRDPSDLRDLAWAPADIPAIQLIEEHFGARKRFET